ncbi:hypothetical protein NE237_014518 [Protea cynaroides]|uniref:DUF4005 domain-containing protein n=1 Tax=Protea cynaroides TaxID=273540 RepID=A0A9Q0KC89_9MAGN|nr:hypothetical protein NE237_014518 [Protea cynaroides]
MGRTSKWIKSFLNGGKKEKEKKFDGQPSSVATENPTTPIIILPSTPKEKRRWSFRRSSATSTATATKDSNSTDMVSTSAAAGQSDTLVEAEIEQKNHVMAVVAATAAAADAALAAAQAAAVAIRLSNAPAPARTIVIQEAAAIRIQSVFRSYLAKRALCALKGLVKLQALVRGHLVRKQATATLRCMQALFIAQERARAQRLRTAEEPQPITQRQSSHRKSSQDIRLRQSYGEMDRSMEENIKIVEMDIGQQRGSSKSRNSYSNHPQDRTDPRFSAYYPSNCANTMQDQIQNSPAPSALTEMSPRACSSHFEDYSYITAQSSPQYYSAVSKMDPTRTPFDFPRHEYEDSATTDYSFHPHYMANTESSRAKLRSHSAPKQRPESYEKQPSRRRSSMEGRNIPRGVRMQRSSSHVGSTVQGYQFPWSIKLDRSTMSLKESECGSTSTVLTNSNYCRSLFAYEHQGNKF